MAELLRAEGISKVFPGVKALDNVNLLVESGKVLGLLGENGAGKSTLLNVLSGIYQPDGGKICVEGKEVKIDSVNKAAELGIAIVHQELKLHGNMTVGENIYMGRLPKNRFGTVQYGRLFKAAGDLLKQYGFPIDPKEKVGRLSIAEQQMVEIAKVLSYDAKIILLDEPTSSLTEEETENLFRTIETLKERGVGIVFISHKLEEIAACCDKVEVLRDGQQIGEMDVKNATDDQLIRMMVGREISERFPEKHNHPGREILEVKNLSRGKYVQDVSFSLREGEVLGIAGLVGAGRSELVRLIFGADKKDSGEIWLDGKKTEIRNPAEAIRNGIFLVPEDRKKQGLVLNQDIENNTVLPNIYNLKRKMAYIDRKKQREMSDQQIDLLRIKCTSGRQVTGTLSGGNQQKVVIGKCLLTNPRIMILDDPTRGIDVGTKAEIYALINKVTEEGRSVILISSELPEVIKMSDRVLVMAGGQCKAILEKDQLSQENVMKYAVGGE